MPHVVVCQELWWLPAPADNPSKEQIAKNLKKISQDMARRTNQLDPFVSKPKIKNNTYSVIMYKVHIVMCSTEHYYMMLFIIDVYNNVVYEMVLCCLVYV